MNSESESSLDTDQFTENITGTKKRTKGSRARARSGSTAFKTDCDPSDNPQSEVVTVKQVRTNKTKLEGKKKKKRKQKKKQTNRDKKVKKNNVMWTVVWLARAHDSRVIKLKFRCKWRRCNFEPVTLCFVFLMEAMYGRCNIIYRAQ